MEALFILTVVTTVYTSPICSIYCEILFSGDNVQWQSYCKCFLDAHINVTTNLHQKQSLYKLLLQSVLLKTKSVNRHELLSWDNKKTTANVKTHHNKTIDSAIENNVNRYPRNLEIFTKLMKRHTETNSSETKKRYFNSNKRKKSDYVSFHALILATINVKAKLPKKWSDERVTSKQTNTTELNKNNETNYILDTDKYGIKNMRTIMGLESNIDADNVNNVSSIYDEKVKNIAPSETRTRNHTDIKNIITTDDFLSYKNYDTTQSIVPKENFTKLELINDLITTTEPSYEMYFLNFKNRNSNAINEAIRKFNKGLKYTEKRGNVTFSSANNVKSENKTIRKHNVNRSPPLESTTKKYINNISIEASQNKNLNRTENFGKTINNTLQMQFNNVLNTSDVTSTTKNEDVYDFHMDYPQILNITAKNQINTIKRKNKRLKTNHFREETTTKKYINKTPFKFPNLILSINSKKKQNINEYADIFQNAESPYQNKTRMFDNNDEVFTVSANDININSKELNINSINSSSAIDSPKKINSNRIHYQEREIPIIRIFSHEFPNDTVISVINGTEFLPNKDFVRYETNIRESDQNENTKKIDNFNSLNEENINNNLLKNKLLPFNKTIIGRLYFITGRQAIPALFVQKPNGDLHLGLNISNI
ncbi:GATA zinc finger domain-containing protein 4-like [Nymphalis io]|uniref:GATA zinc finger domain-containing protein 4-like n=1 Tax=Inachis io TaxID=171585 RepID=UPI0021686B97|nr:GATA zinc finger domain-containing protein 4-like [Nymphalis io]